MSPAELPVNFGRSSGGLRCRGRATLQGGAKTFMARSPLNKRNDGRMTLPCDGVEGAWKSRVSPGAHWDLGEAGDPNRAVLQDTRLVPGERIAPHRCGDWRMMVVMDGSLKIAGRTLGKDDFLRIAPDSATPEIQTGATGAQLLEGARTSHGAQRRPLA